MDGFDVDLFVIGGGSGGVRAARVAASHGARVMLAEESRLGGTCVIRGCVPKKLLVYAGRYGDMLKEAEEFGWDIPDRRFDWRALVSAKDKEISRLEGAYARMQASAGVEVLKSRAVVEDAHTVRLLSDGRRVTARVILVATGARPDVPPIDGISLGITSDDAFDLPELPRRLVIGGAGYIAVEFAGLFSALGSDVTIVCRGDNVLRGFDEDLREALAAAYQGRGIRLMFNDAINRIERTEAGQGATPSAAPLLATTANGARLAADRVLLAFGRVPNTRGLGLGETGVELDGAGAVVVDENARTRVPSIYAVGDVTNRFNLAPVAIREGHAFADSVFGRSPWRVGYGLIPTAVFSTPEIGTVGLSEAEAREKFPFVEVYKTAFLALRAKITGSPDRTLVKLVVDGESQRIVGVHLFADDASEMIQLITVALEAGATHEQFVSAMAVHPTIGEELVTLRTPAERYDRRAVQAA